ncbi:MAG TPA: hypothetical protein VFM70_04460 [Salinimicrobium sp.]|nr:hypothetical protein [Salinimicrobium sp.]
MNRTILNKVERLEAFARAALDEATAIRKELGGGTSSSPKRGMREKEKAAALNVVKNRKKLIS